MKKPNLAAMTPEVAKAIEEMMAEQGERFSLEKVNLAELARRTGLSRQKLRRMKTHNFEDTQHAAKGRKSPATLLSGYTGLLDGLLRSGVTNSAVCLSRLKENGYTGSRPPLSVISPRTSISCRLLATLLPLKGTVDAGISLPPARHTRWTGAS